ncbi:hypothetical protein [Stenotrophomonas sp. PSU_St142]
MSTNDKTLAGVQPGGRVRLGDQLPPLPCTHYNACGDGSDPLYTSEQMRDYARAALSAQPSPGGKGDSRSERAETFLRQYLTYLRSSPRQGLRPRWCDVYEALEGAIEALAARQPVRSSTVSDDMMDVVDRLGSEHDEVDPRAWDHMLIYAPTDKLYARLAARQPVGEPIGWYTDDHLTDRSATTYDRTVAERWRAKGWPVSPLYAAPPAQSVDLGQFRASVKGALIRMQQDSDTECAAHKRELQRLLALIDSQAVGK